MEKTIPNFYAIIPANVRYDKELKANSKLMFGEITALSNKQGYCWASNKYFADLYEVTPQAISNWIKILEKKGYIRIEYIRNGKEIKQRNIYIDVSTNINRVSINNDRVSINNDRGYQQNFKESTTVINNTFNNTNNKDLYTEIFNHYLSKENLIKHTKFTEPMKKGIDKVIKIYGLDLDYIKRIIDRHSEKVEQDKNKTEFKTTTRTLSELLGQKKYRSEDYICSDYLDEKYVEIKKEIEKENTLKEIIENSEDWRMGL